MVNLMNTDQRPDADCARLAPNHTLEVIGVCSLGLVAVSHVVDLSGKFAEAPYLGVAYLGVIGGAWYAAVLILRHNRLGWTAGGLLCLATLIGFAFSRTTGLPSAPDDIGNWTEPRAVVAAVSEICAVVLAAFARRLPRA